MLTATVIPYSQATEDVMASGQQPEQSRVPGCIRIQSYGSLKNVPGLISPTRSDVRHWPVGVLRGYMSRAQLSSTVEVCALRVWLAVGYPQKMPQGLFKHIHDVLLPRSLRPVWPPLDILGRHSTLIILRCLCTFWFPDLMVKLGGMGFLVMLRLILDHGVEDTGFNRIPLSTSVFPVFLGRYNQYWSLRFLR